MRLEGINQMLRLVNFISEAIILSLLIVFAIPAFLWVLWKSLVLAGSVLEKKKATRGVDEPKNPPKDPKEEDSDENEDERKKNDESEHDIGGGD